MRIISIVIYLILSVGGLILIKMGANSMNLAIDNGMFKVSIGMKVIMGLICYVASFLIYTFYIIREFELSYIFPIVTGITQILVVLAGVFILKEQINAYSIVGMLLILVGIFCLNIR